MKHLVRPSTWPDLNTAGAEVMHVHAHWKVLSTTTMPEPKPFERLPGNIKPLHYNITLQPNLVKCVFHGSEEIDIEIKEATKQVKFNTLDLTLRDIKIRLPSGEDLVPASTEISTANEMVILTFDETLPIGTAKLSLSFDGELNDKMKGMYRSKYTS
ncbi:Puromycin-sensitive aminopeptidase [Portunus trituberculatus]|uniref:Puromycin-sensitive aminopeptidase n=1 Tax=Portunus trituberculatus TaxID=210409 RepID=A0A5B7I4D4_PORTR|nr:Puromycin-sensitive aminopeptidase [Portunus trituberculatus]